MQSKCFQCLLQCLKAWEDAIRAIQAKEVSHDTLESQGTENSPNKASSSEERGDTMEESSSTSEAHEGATNSEPSVWAPQGEKL